MAGLKRDAVKQHDRGKHHGAAEVKRTHAETILKTDKKSHGRWIGERK